MRWIEHPTGVKDFSIGAKKFAAGMKRAAAEMRRHTKAYRRAVETALRGWSRRREQAGFMCRWSRVKPEDGRPALRVRDCRWSQTR